MAAAAAAAAIICHYLRLFGSSFDYFAHLQPILYDVHRRSEVQNPITIDRVAPGLIVQLSTALLGQSVRVWFP